MCFSSGGKQKVYEPASAPAAPLGPSDVPSIGMSREKENKKNFGSIDGPDYRMRRD